MSTISKITFGCSVVAAIGIIYHVCNQQNVDRQNLKKGVLRDYERAQQRKIQNTYKLQQQKELTKILKADQLKQQAASTET